jgi:threonine dehydrogenase-like Zn-dependent dehydrogenase
MSQSKSVKAVAMIAPGKMELRNYPYPRLDHDSAILKVEMTGVCGTDKHIFKGEATNIRGKSIYPYVGGHEVIGTVVEIGETAARTMDYDHQLLKPGDRVALAVEVNCGECWYCRNQYNNTTCANQVMAYGLHPNADTAPFLRGGFSQYMYIMPGTTLFKIPEGLPTDVAVFVEELAVAYHSLARAVTPFPAMKE